MAKKHLPLRDFAAKLKSAGKACTLVGVGPVSEVVVRATFEACKKAKCPPIFIASRNQVDLKELGHGYLMGGMDAKAFVDVLHRMAKEIGYKGHIYICRDHGGPWQRNVELDEKYPVDRAMDIAKKSFRADIEAGFNYLHIDPTKCPHPHSHDQLVDWTVELEEYCENIRKELGKDDIDYEVGTEDIKGGLTTTATYEALLKKLTEKLAAKGLPAPTCVVGQTGTLCKVDHNVGHFDAKGTAELVKIAAKYGVGFKEHNGDYMSAASCRIHPELGVTGMNVAPEFGLVETDALLSLAALESKLVQEGWLPAVESSDLRQLVLEKTFTASPWKKWMTEDIKNLPEEQVQADTAMRLLIGRVCGHYTYDDAEVKAARAKLCENINKFQMVDAEMVGKGDATTAEAFITRQVRGAIAFYIRHFKLDGVNTLA